ncbi:hypothetical protein AB0I28_35775 [Phytomonospora sp. NPDC050363]|uniref:hypothetical protein n=1 Tax=Phytomonospora sp. NPDC050363 TaxID=3155642 RepID=UPI003402FCC2
MRGIAKKVEDQHVNRLPRSMRRSARRNYRRLHNTGGDGCAVVILAAAALPGFLAAAWFLFS